MDSLNKEKFEEIIYEMNKIETIEKFMEELDEKENNN